jgi:hypothetical protein
MPGMLCAQGKGKAVRVFNAPYGAVWKAANAAWDSLYFPTLTKDEKAGLLESDTIRIPGDTALAWMGDVPRDSWWQEGRYALTLRIKPIGKARARVQAKMWIFARGVPNPAMVSLRPHVGVSNGTLETRVMDRIAQELRGKSPPK